MKYKIKDYADIRHKVDKMTVDELLTCVICPDYPLGQKTPVRTTTSLMFHPTDVETAHKASIALNEAGRIGH